MSSTVTSRRDPSLQATLSKGTPLCYSSGSDPSLDRPAHVRAGSGLVRLGGRIAIIQDDALFIALLNPGTGEVSPVALPPGEDGLRLFDEARGNKHFKLDLEACTTVPWGGGEALLAFGSGSSARRETLVLLAESGEMRTIELPGFYAALRAETRFSGSELNIEGVLYADGRLRLFNRGNGAPRYGLQPVNAVGELDWVSFWTHVTHPDSYAPPALEDIRQYDLGMLNGGKLGFTDASMTPLGLMYAASAEDSPDATRDGIVTGSAVGILSSAEGARWIELRDPDGQLFPHKVEGLCPADDPGCFYLVVDVDDPDQASELYQLDFSGAS
jgi:hypothetical protein